MALKLSLRLLPLLLLRSLLLKLVAVETVDDLKLAYASFEGVECLLKFVMCLWRFEMAVV